MLATLALVIWVPNASEAAVVLWGGMLVAVMLDAALSFSRPKVTEINGPDEVYVGEAGDLRLVLSGVRNAPTGRIDWPEGVKGKAEFSFDSLSDGTWVSVTPCQAVRRGAWRLERLWLTWPSRFGLLEFIPRVQLDVQVRVIPNIRPVYSGQITTTVLSTLYGVKENRAIGEGSEFHQLQDFVQGMDVRMIDWKRSARRRSLVAKELRAERNHHVIVALDNGYLMREEIAGLPKIDHAINAALATAWAAAIGGDLVGYYAYDVRPTAFFPPEPGRSAFPRLRSRTAELSYAGRETNHTLALSELNARTPKRSLIIVFTDFVDTTSAELLLENIRVLTKRHLVIFVVLRDPELEELVDSPPNDLDAVATLVSGGQLLSERRLVLEKLVRLGVTVVEAKPGELTPKLVSKYLEIKARELI